MVFVVRVPVSHWRKIRKEVVDPDWWCRRDEIQQLSRIIALMIAECVFAYEEPFEIEVNPALAVFLLPPLLASRRDDATCVCSICSWSRSSR